MADVITPDWAKLVLPNMQAFVNKTHDEQVSAYNAAKRDWINENVSNRAAGRDITPFTKPIPKLITVFWNGSTWDQTEVDDPNVHPPVLPPPTPELPVTAFKSDAPAADMAQQQMMAMIFQLLMEIKAALPGK